ncbi:hypothetical protein [Microcoleus sp. MON1_C1]
MDDVSAALPYGGYANEEERSIRLFSTAIGNKSCLLPIAHT